MNVSISHPFSDEIPGFLQSHLNHLARPTISIDVIKERGYWSVLGKKALADSGFFKAQQRYTDILIPLHGVDGEIVSYQYRPDHPRFDTRDRKGVVDNGN